MMIVIRNIVLKRLVTDGRRIPMNFDSINKANLWLNRIGDPSYLIPVRVEAVLLTPEEKEQLLKVNFQKKRFK